MDEQFQPMYREYIKNVIIREHFVQRLNVNYFGYACLQSTAHGGKVYPEVKIVKELLLLR